MPSEVSRASAAVCGATMGILALAPVIAAAQSAIEHHAWQDTTPLQPVSRTAEAITGPLRVTNRSISFGGRIAGARFVGRFWRVWGFDSEKHTADIYELRGDPGKLRQSNTLCGVGEKARYVVLWESYSDISGGAVNMAVWSSRSPPPQDRVAPVYAEPTAMNRRGGRFSVCF